MGETPVFFVDTETLGLDECRHAIWEIAYVLRTPGEMAVERELLVRLTDEELAAADSTALRLNHFYDRYDREKALDPRAVAWDIAQASAGAALLAANPNFDAVRLERFMRANGAPPAWHYRLCCIENLAAGRLGIRPGWDPAQLSEMLGVERPEADKHTAMGDVRWNVRMYDAIYSSPVKQTPAPKASKKAAAETKEPPPPSEPEPVAKEPDSRAILDDLRENGGDCEDCKTHVDPQAAVVSFTRHKKVLCMSGDDGGCYSRYGKAS
jgi:hypothetical protein